MDTTIKSKIKAAVLRQRDEAIDNHKRLRIFLQGTADLDEPCTWPNEHGKTWREVLNASKNAVHDWETVLSHVNDL